jgi:hypothetical protein
MSGKQAFSSPDVRTFWNESEMLQKDCHKDPVFNTSEARVFQTET